MGIAQESKKDATLKVYSQTISEPGAVAEEPAESCYLIENEHNRPIRLLKSEFDGVSLKKSDLFNYTLNCVIRADALLSDAFKKEFNYMMK